MLPTRAPGVASAAAHRDATRVAAHCRVTGLRIPIDGGAPAARAQWLRRCEARLVQRLPDGASADPVALARSLWTNTSLVLMPEEAADMAAGMWGMTG
jgi:hypothetical protein